MVTPASVWSYGGMSNDDDIERLLREVEGATGGGASQAATPAKRQENLPEKRSGGGSEPMFLVISAVIGILGWLLGFLPFVNGTWLGIGGFLGAFVALNIGRRLS